MLTCRGDREHGDLHEPSPPPPFITCMCTHAEGGEGTVSMVICMELCDLGSLQSSVNKGVFRKTDNTSRALSVGIFLLGPGVGAGQQCLKTAYAWSHAGGHLSSPPPSPLVTCGWSHFLTPRSCLISCGWSHFLHPQALYLTLLEVALALKHLHSMHLEHCDIKADNVLLKSNTLDPRWVGRAAGYVPGRMGWECTSVWLVV